MQIRIWTFSRLVVLCALFNLNAFADTDLKQIEGRLYAGNDSGQYPLEAIEIRLLDQSGAVIANTRTTSEGRYAFDQIPAGNYRVQPDRQALARRELSTPPPQPVNLSGDSDLINVGTTVLYGKSLSCVPAAHSAKAPPAQATAAQLPAGGYTLQLMAGHKAASVQQFIDHHRLKDTYQLKVRRNGADWHLLLQGSYPSYKAARRAAASLPAGLRPWIRKVGSLRTCC
ncbi:SPOR domain-containing protein [Marinobacterium arenosum]|uniref:SPOR domain-containing protein n=1 Tax=Marinobacterium arenosum TaxID=2862496 RepID=UPI001C98D568|nr:SPOR domain-containing protein [Marinobacterium arenosum]MBY4678696.1 SPOR domain-containing protein [Marinobacterium arenosum]